MIKRGALIVIEGLDRSGKSTQCEMLLRKLEQCGIASKVKKFPGKKVHTTHILKYLDRDTPIGKMIDLYLKNLSDLDDRAIHLLFSANRWETEESIVKDIQDGITVIVDRYVYSGIAFSCAKGLDFNWCRNPDLGLPQPDAVIFLDINEKAACARSGYGTERYENSETQHKVRTIFNRLQQLEKDNWHVVDASGTFEHIHTKIMNIVLKCIKESQSKTLKRLM